MGSKIPKGTILWGIDEKNALRYGGGKKAPPGGLTEKDSGEQFIRD